MSSLPASHAAAGSCSGAAGDDAGVPAGGTKGGSGGGGPAGRDAPPDEAPRSGGHINVTATIPARRYTEADPAGGEWHYEALVANRPGKPRLDERMERICVENNGPFGGGAVGVPLTEPIIDR